MSICWDGLNFGRTIMASNCITRQNWWRILPFLPSNVNDCDDLTAPNTVISAVDFCSVFLASIWQHQS
nr:hypothetical protein [uncultured Aggregatibacter sp.]